MLKVQQDFQKVLRLLALGDNIKLTFDGSDISVRYVEDASKLMLTTPVYTGTNYIPVSVRKCVSQKLNTGRPGVQTYLTVDEQLYQISLNYFGDAENMSHHHFKDILEEFSGIAEKWRINLDEHDRNDWVYVKTK